MVVPSKLISGLSFPPQWLVLSMFTLTIWPPTSWSHHSLLMPPTAVTVGSAGTLKVARKCHFLPEITALGALYIQVVFFSRIRV